MAILGLTIIPCSYCLTSWRRCAWPFGLQHVVWSHAPASWILFVAISLNSWLILRWSTVSTDLNRSQLVSPVAFKDIRLITSCITLLAIDLVPHKADDLKFNFARVSAQSFAVRGKTQKNIYKATGQKESSLDPWRAMGNLQVSAVYDSHNLKLQRIEQDYDEEVLQL